MTTRIIQIDNLEAARKELHKIGADSAGIELMAPKGVPYAVKLQAIKPTAANIIKQDLLSLGGEAATAHGAINHSIEATDLLLFGTDKQFKKLVKKLKMHVFRLPQVAREIEAAITNYSAVPKPILGLDFSKKIYIMGILNVTPDSFSDGGKFVSVAAAVNQALKMIAEGADIIDVGGESTRPGSEPVPPAEEIKRVIPVIEQIRKKSRIIISIDTVKTKVAEAAIKAGANMVNDVKFDKKMARLAAKYKIPVCIMHMQGTPGNMQKNPVYHDLMAEILNYLSETLAIAKKAGILTENIIVDPGIGFGKTVEHNLEIIKRLRELKVLGCPILIGPSRKNFIGKILDLPVEQRLNGTLAAAVLSAANGANVVRVHDVAEVKQAAQIAYAVNSNTGGK